MVESFSYAYLMKSGDVEMKLQNAKIILFDGICNFCNGSVNFIIDRDKKKQFLFAALQSDSGKELLHFHHIKLSENFDSIILIKNNKVYQKSSAVLEIAKDLGGMWAFFYVFKLIPAFINNIFYDFVARNRYKIFGKTDACRIPKPSYKERFLD